MIRRAIELLTGPQFPRRMRALARRAGLAIARLDHRTCTVVVPAEGFNYEVHYTNDGTYFVPSRWRFPCGVPHRIRYGLGRINTALGGACGLSWHRDPLPDGHAYYLRLRRPHRGLTPEEFRRTADGLAAKVAGIDGVIGRHFFSSDGDDR